MCDTEFRIRKGQGLAAWVGVAEWQQWQLKAGEVAAGCPPPLPSTHTATHPITHTALTSCSMHSFGLLFAHVSLFTLLQLRHQRRRPNSIQAPSPAQSSQASSVQLSPALQVLPSNTSMHCPIAAFQPQSMPPTSCVPPSCV